MLAVRRTILRPRDKTSLAKLLETEGVRSIAPLDSVLRIDDLPFKMTREMMCEVAFWGQNQSSYKAGSDVIKKVHGIDLSPNLVRAVTDYVGKIVYDEDTRKATSLYNE